MSLFDALCRGSTLKAGGPEDADPGMHPTLRPRVPSQAARQLQAAAGAAPGLGPANPLFTLEQALGIAQHHDAIAGTAQQVVNDDYLLRLEAGRVGAYASVSESLATLTGYADAPFTVCPLANVSICPALESGAAVVAAVHNALSEAAVATAGVRLVAGFPPGVASYAVFDALGEPVTAQLVPLSPRDAELRTQNGGNANVTVQWLCFVAPVLPAAGFSTFFLVPQVAWDCAGSSGGRSTRSFSFLRSPRWGERLVPLRAKLPHCLLAREMMSLFRTAGSPSRLMLPRGGSGFTLTP